jgi:flagellar capping protein FliD
LSELLKFYEFICENNPLLLDYLDTLDFSSEKEEQEEQKKVIKFEDKYLEKFKNCSNEYQFTELELDDEKKEYERIKIDYENKKYEIIYEIQEKLYNINKIQEKGGILNEKNDPSPVLLENPWSEWKPLDK